MQEKLKEDIKRKHEEERKRKREEDFKEDIEYEHRLQQRAEEMGRLKERLRVLDEKIKEKKDILGEGLSGFLDPNLLIERLDLLMESKKAGNTGVRNELISICDELKRQKILNAKQHKNIIKKC